VDPVGSAAEVGGALELEPLLDVDLDGGQERVGGQVQGHEQVARQHPIQGDDLQPHLASRDGDLRLDRLSRLRLQQGPLSEVAAAVDLGQRLDVGRCGRRVRGGPRDYSGALRDHVPLHGLPHRILRDELLAGLEGHAGDDVLRQLHAL